jgi:amidase
LASKLEREGCRVGRDTDQVPSMIDLARTFHALLMAQLSADMPDDQYAAAGQRERTSRGDDGAGDAFNAESTTLSHRDWIRLDRHRLDLAAMWRETFQNWDVAVCPAAPTCAFAHDNRPFADRKLLVDGEPAAYTNISLWSTLAAPNGLPATAVPIGRAKDGMPIGAQIIGPHLEDRTTLKFAHLVEHAFGGFVAPA